MTIETHSREAQLFGISGEVMSKEIGILTSFGPIQPFLGTFVLSKEISLSGTMVINSIFPRNCPSICRRSCVEK